MDDDCNELLLTAVRKNNLNEVKRLLQDPNINLNYDIGDGSTVFYETLFVKDYTLFTYLLDVGYDINVKNERRETPLHVAVIYSPVIFVHELIKRGADINAKQNGFLTPLHHAAFYNNVEAACLLLYYGADANAVCVEKKTPLMLALEENNVEVAKILFDFCDDFFCTGASADATLDHAIWNENPLVVDILKTCQNESKYCNCLQHSLQNESTEMFKLIWAEFNQQIRLDYQFLRTFFSALKCRFSNDGWLECMNLLLNSTTAFELLQTKRSYVVELENCHFLLNVLCCLKRRSVELNERLAIIYHFLSFGIKVTTKELNLCYLLYGLNDELIDVLKYALNYMQRTDFAELLMLPKYSSIFDGFFHILNLVDLCEEYFIEYVLYKSVASSLGFCSLSYNKKREILGFCQQHFTDCQEIIKRLDAIPEVPSLLELSRDQSREFISQMCNDKKPYRFYDVLKHLNLPRRLKDIINFKLPIY